MVKLTRTLSRLSPTKVLVVGDFMLDTYTIGKAKRISPEAPVAVVNVIREESRPGGAGNVALNLISLGATVVALGRVGRDLAGELICLALKKEGVDADGLVVQDDYWTPKKNRVISDNQQIVRVDFENNLPLEASLEEQLIAQLPRVLEEVTAVAISDYGKGLLSRRLLQAVYAEAARYEVPVITDPKGVDFSKYRGTTIIKPNLGEAYAAAGLAAETPLDEAAKKILAAADAQVLMVTRSEHGISLFDRQGKRTDFPVRMREMRDVTGAGDTVLAMLTYAVANRLSLDEAAQLSNIAAGIAIERFGCARVTLADLARRLLEFDVTNKIFDEEHLYALKAALSDQNYSLLSLSGSQGMTSPIFAAIHRLGSQSSVDLILHVRDLEVTDPFVQLLATLQAVKFILVHKPSVSALCEALPPKEIYAVLADGAIRPAHLDEIGLSMVSK